MAIVQKNNSPVAELLEEELSRAKILPDEQLPNQVVRMNSLVLFCDIDTQEKSQLILVYPHQADSQSNKISILAPVGAALIGLWAGQSIDWPLPNGNIKRIRVISIEQQS